VPAGTARQLPPYHCQASRARAWNACKNPAREGTSRGGGAVAAPSIYLSFGGRPGARGVDTRREREGGSRGRAARHACRSLVS
jgi:hypothetical protein